MDQATLELLGLHKLHFALHLSYPFEFQHFGMTYLQPLL
jgi:hypothetical protein